MKMLLNLSIAALLTISVGSMSASAATTPNDPTTGKAKKTAVTNQPNHKQTAVKENKKFTIVNFTYGGPNTSAGRTTPSNYTAVIDVSTSCPSGTTTLCGIVFDDVTYPLVGGLPSTTFLTNEVNVHWNDFSTHSFTVNGVTYFKKN